MIEIDGSYGESGGSMLRQSLGLSMLTRKPFVINNIRKSRAKPGLNWQHLTALNAAQRACDARVEGNHLGSTRVYFEPGPLKNINLKIDIGTAGSITLLLQTFLLPALFSGKKFSLEVTGGTDVAWSIPVDYFSQVLIPQLKRYAEISFKIIRRGYYPKGNGRVIFKARGKDSSINNPNPLNLTIRGDVLKISGISHSSKSLANNSVADRQAESARLLLSQLRIPIDIATAYVDSLSAGSGITLWALCSSDDNKNFDYSKPIIIGSSALGEKKLKAESVGENAAINLIRTIESGVPCDEFLADQLIPLLGVVGGSLRTNKITNHTRSNVYLVEKFLNIKFNTDPESGIISVVKNQ